MLKAKKGRLLISEPSLNDNVFFKSVVLLTHHNDEESIGLILNHPTKINLNEILNDIPLSDLPIYIGGPVERNSLHYVHTIGTKIEGSQEILDGLYWGGDFEVVRKMVENNEVDSSNIRFFAGYSGWDKGQLLSEIGENSWITVPADKESCMKLSSNKELWSSFIKKMDAKYAIWTNLPADPFLN